MALLDNPRGNYRFLPGISAYSSGVVAMPGYEIVHVLLQKPMPYREGFAMIDRFLEAQGRSRYSLCAIELRIPVPFSFAGFAEFNQEYLELLIERDLLLGQHNPIARTNVAPALYPPAEPCLFGFSYTAPIAEATAPPTFVVAGAGELMGGRKMGPEAVIRLGENSPEALREKAAYVMDRIEERRAGLQVAWADVTTVNIYTVHPLLLGAVSQRMGQAGVHGVHWYHSRPPMADLEVEMDLRGVRRELRLF